MLPAEIFDHIFSFLQRDRSALTSCSAAHPFLSSLAEQYLFIHLFICVGTHAHASTVNGITVSDLSRSLSERPNLASHVRSITIDGRGSYYEAFQKLSTILPLFQHSESLSLRNIQWLRLPESFCSALQNFLRAPHMLETHLRGCADLPLSILLDDSPNIKSLKLDSSDCNFVHYTQNIIPTSLESLSLGEVADEPDFMLWAEPRVTNLISLHVKTTLFPIPDLTPIFHASLASLKSLTFAIGTSFRTVYSNDGRYTPTVSSPQSNFPFDLSVLVRLEVVTIHARIEGRIYPINEPCEPLRYGHWCKASFPAISSLISTAGPSLERLVLDLDCSAIDGASDLCYAVEWEPLILLCDSLAHLRVDVCICASDSQGQLPVDEVVDSLSANEDLSRLMKRGSLTIEPPLTPPDF